MTHLMLVALCLPGFALLALAMERHQQDVLGGALTARRSRLLRLTGRLALCVGWTVAVANFGVLAGTVVWCCHLMVMAGVVYVALALRLRR